jgi:hypothetical protein
MSNLPHAANSPLNALPVVRAARYVLPLREGGSLPALIEDQGGRLWVVKFRGAGQGVGALVAEVVVGELARALGFLVPELALVELPARFGASEGDPEVQELLAGSVGLNVGLAFLSGALGYDPSGAWPMDSALAARLVALDVAVSNVDRTHRNPNLLWAGERLWLIDHGAALYWQHSWDGGLAGAEKPLPGFQEHVALPMARGIPAAARQLAGELNEGVLEAALARVPEDWLAALAPDPAARRRAYVQRLLARARALPRILEGQP